MHKKQSNISIIADDRERRSSVVKALQDMDAVHVKIGRLTVGDYFADNRLIVERKTLADFAVSIVDGRLFKQAVSLAGSKYNSVLILEGTGREISESGVSREALQGALINISLILGIPVLRSLNTLETANLIRYAAGQIGNIAQRGFQRPGYRPKTKRKRQVYLLQGLPGIGRQRAETLLDAFGSVEKVIAAGRKAPISVSTRIP